MKRFLIPIVLLILASCSGVRVLNTEASEGFKLTNYKTFDFYKLEAAGDTTANFPANVEVLVQSITSHLKQKGLQPSTSDPDLRVNIGIVVETKAQTRESNFNDGARYSGQRNYSWKREDIVIGHYKEGTVTVHLVDPKTNKLMWKSSVQGVIPKNSKVPAMIEEGMTALFAKLQ